MWKKKQTKKTNVEPSIVTNDDFPTVIALQNERIIDLLESLLLEIKRLKKQSISAAEILGGK